MLWLARVYAGGSASYPTLFYEWPNVISDWARRLREHEFRDGRGLPTELEPTLLGLIRADRTHTATETRFRVADQSLDPGRARGAVQGGR